MPKEDIEVALATDGLNAGTFNQDEFIRSSCIEELKKKYPEKSDDQIRQMCQGLLDDIDPAIFVELPDDEDESENKKRYG